MATVLAAAMLIAVHSVSIDDSDPPMPMPDIPVKTLEVAEANGVDPVALLGAQVMTHMEPDEYLCSVHEGPCPKPPPPAPVSAPTGVWDRLAQCESTGDWHANTGNGYSGGLQFDRTTWISYGGGVYASAAYLASRDQQIAIAERLRASRGFAPWPACSRRLGLR